jgi:hypothetical protein
MQLKRSSYDHSTDMRKGEDDRRSFLSSIAKGIGLAGLEYLFACSGGCAAS